MAMASLDLDFELLRCEEHIADLTRRINQLIETRPAWVAECSPRPSNLIAAVQAVVFSRATSV